MPDVLVYGITANIQTAGASKSWADLSYQNIVGMPVLYQNEKC